MAPLVLQGETLGQRHRHYNSIVKAECGSQPATLETIDYDAPDISNLLKIDVACATRNIPYILNVFACDDILYVSRAIKQSRWLITDDQYKHIINPKYLHDQLFPNMLVRGKNKLLLAVRLTLNNEQRSEEFYNYFQDSNFNLAQKWLPYCSLALIENVVKNRLQDISIQIQKRLCERSFNTMKTIMLDTNYYHYSKRKMFNSVFPLHTNDLDQLFDLLDKVNEYMIPDFGKKITMLVIKKCPHRILNNFYRYRNYIDIPTFAKSMKKEDIKDFLLKQKENAKDESWFTFENIKHFVKYLPEEEKFQFVKQVFIEKGEKQHFQAGMQTEAIMDVKRSMCYGYSSNSSEKQPYDWYRFAPFTTAFPELKKMVRIESSPAERNSILTVMLQCAGRNQQHIQTLLKFYREKHINEPFKFKIQFINSFLSQTNTLKFDESTWNILNDLFSSMEVYMESDNNVPFCIQNIIMYKVIHNQTIPEIIIKKFEFSTLKKYRKKLNTDEKDKVFSYLYKHLYKKLQDQQIRDISEISIAISLIQDTFELIKDWNKELSDHPELIEKIREIVKIKKQQSWDINLAVLFNFLKSWRKHMFEESLVMYPTEDTYLNILKHDPCLLKRYASDVHALFLDDKVPLRKVLNKLRIYWTDSLAQEWADEYLQRLENSSGHKALIQGVCVLLPRNQINAIIEKYAPIETKINWNNTDTVMLNIRKNIAKNMQLVRPSLDVGSVLLYAKEDYLQYTLPSLNAILDNMSPNKTSSCLLKLLNSPVSLQKHGIRTAFSKLKVSQVKDLMQSIWIKTKNSTIRTIIFKLTHKLLCAEKKHTAIAEIWEMLSMFIDQLSADENRMVYTTMGNVRDLPPIIKGKFLMKCHYFLRSLPAKANCDSILSKLEVAAVDTICSLETSFIEDVLLRTFNEIIVTKSSWLEVDTKIDILSVYLINSNTEELQMQKYENILVPALTVIFAAWRISIKKEYVAKTNFNTLINRLSAHIITYGNKNVFIPIKMLNDIKNRINNTLNLERDYCTITKFNLLVLFFEILNDYKKSRPIGTDVEFTDDESQCTTGCKRNDDKNRIIWNNICKDIAPLFGKACLTYFKNDISSNYTSLFSMAAEVLLDVFSELNIEYLSRYNLLRSMLSDESATICYFIVLNLVKHMGTYHTGCEEIADNIYRLVKAHPSKEVHMHFYRGTSDFDIE